MEIQHSAQQQIFTTIKDVILAHIGMDTVLHPESRLEDDLAIDSLELVELGVKLEKLFDIKIRYQQMRSCKTLQDLADLVQSTKDAHLCDRKP